MKRNNTALIMAVAILTILLTGPAFCGDYTTYQNDDAKYSIEHPSAWGTQLFPSSDGSQKTAISSQNRMSNIVIYANRKKDGISASEFFAGVRKNTVGSYNVTKKGTETINGNKADWYILTPKSSQKLKMVIYVFLKNNRAFMVSGGCPEQAFDKNLPIFLKAIRTFKIH